MKSKCFPGRPSHLCMELCAATRPYPLARLFQSVQKQDVDSVTHSATWVPDGGPDILDPKEDRKTDPTGIEPEQSLHDDFQKCFLATEDSCARSTSGPQPGRPHPIHCPVMDRQIHCLFFSLVLCPFHTSLVHGCRSRPVSRPFPVLCPVHVRSAVRSVLSGPMFGPLSGPLSGPKYSTLSGPFSNPLSNPMSKPLSSPRPVHGLIGSTVQWRKAHLQVKMYKAPQVRTNFGS